MTSPTEQAKADVVTVLSSELVASVMERYFNETMFNTQAMGSVKVLALSSSGDGFMFGLSFVPEVTGKGELDMYVDLAASHIENMKVIRPKSLNLPRDRKGKYVKVNGDSNGVA